jgi:uncharacterized hydantoinase/oxoprolinase family protein
MSDHPRDLILLELEAERLRQDRKWGEQNHPDGTGGDVSEALACMARIVCEERHGAGVGTWRDILAEEFHEAVAETDHVRLREELLQVAAVAVAWVEAIDRR